ncbi:MAG: hypothetical protein M3Q07_16485 [Pseudobdellovibrionaceae bacterium]|nr:hypothetical protein [Pseudobdellovibrionaceae bacterium]
MISIRNLALTIGVTLASGPSVFAASCPDILRAFFDSVQSQRYSVHVERTSNALWSNDNAFSTYSNFSAYVQNINPYRFIQADSAVNFLNRNGSISRVDKENVSITELGVIEIYLTSWSNTLVPMRAAVCDSIGSDQVLIQASHSNSGGTRKTIYNFTLTKTLIVQ